MLRTRLEPLTFFYEGVFMVIKGIKEETVLDWLRKAANHAEEIEALLLANQQLTRVQLDAMWTYVGHKGEKATIPRSPIGAPSGEALL
jgi:hypothetical protein